MALIRIPHLAWRVAAIAATSVLLIGCSQEELDPVVARGTVVGDPGESLRVDVLLLAPGDGPTEVGQTVEVPEVARARSGATGEFALQLDPSDPTLRGLVADDGALNLQIVAFEGARQWHCAFTRQVESDGGQDASWSGATPEFELTTHGGCGATVSGVTADTAAPR